MSSLQEFEQALTEFVVMCSSLHCDDKRLIPARARLVEMYREAIEKADELDKLKELARKDREEWQAKQPSYQRDPLEGIHDQ